MGHHLYPWDVWNLVSETDTETVTIQWDKHDRGNECRGQRWSRGGVADSFWSSRGWGLVREDLTKEVADG